MLLSATVASFTIHRYVTRWGFTCTVNICIFIGKVLHKVDQVRCYCAVCSSLANKIVQSHTVHILTGSIGFHCVEEECLSAV